MNRRGTVLGLVFGLVLAVGSGPAWADREGSNDNGTRLSPPPEITCSQNDATVVGVLVSSGSADSADILVDVDMAGAFKVGTIPSGPAGWTFFKRYKSADYAFVLPGLEPGEHTVEACFVQSGAHGRHPKATCGLSTFTCGGCTTPTCCNAMFLGDLNARRACCESVGGEWAGGEFPVCQ